MPEYPDERNPAPEPAAEPSHGPAAEFGARIDAEFGTDGEAWLGLGLDPGIDPGIDPDPDLGTMPEAETEAETEAGTGPGLAGALLAANPAAALASVLVKPRLRGVFHQWAFVVSLFTGVFLVLRATTTVATIAAAVYAGGVSGLFGVSALYHRVTWRPNVRRWLRQLDHAMIFLLIAGTYTPVGLLVLKGRLGAVVLALVWGGAIAGITLNLVFKDAPKWSAALVYVILGWVAVITMPQLLERMGVAGVALIVLGGLVYSIGALVYATRRPNPAPAVFGYHEIFHLLVIAGVAFHFVAITLVVGDT